jgi:hypothetical protein
MTRKEDLIVAPLSEGALILLLAVLGWATRWPLVFASLGPTAYEMVEQPQSKSARPYNVVVGHLAALASGWAALWICHARASPGVSEFVPGPRLWAATLAAALTTLITLLVRASQPAALATALLVSLGIMQTLRDTVAIVIAVLILAAAGEPVRRRRLTAARNRELATSGG